MNAGELRTLIEGLQRDESLTLTDKEGHKTEVQVCAKGWLFKYGNLRTYANLLKTSTVVTNGLFLYMQFPTCQCVKVGAIRCVNEFTWEIERII